MSWLRGRPNVGSLPRILAALPVLVLLVSWLAPGVARGSVPPPPMVTSPLDFSGSYPIDGLTPFAHTNRIGYLSCPNSTLCVALDGNGNILTSGNPASPTDSWHITPLPLYGDDGLQCPTTTFCAGLAASDANGEEALVTSTDPTGGPGAWQVVTAPANASLLNISCPSADFCAGVDGYDILTSTDPAGGAGSWQTARYTSDDNPAFDPITCASASLCLIPNGSGSTSPPTPPAVRPHGRSSPACPIAASPARPCTCASGRMDPASPSRPIRPAAPGPGR